LPLNATSADVIFGQDLFFLGFPLYTDTDVMKGFPLPLIKKAVLSGSLRQGGKTEVFLLDGHNNPGFSGGPVVFKPGNKPNAEYRVLGLVSAYRLEEQDVYFNRKPTGLKHAENAGIMLAPAIKIATDMIKSNPIGLALT
jgi:hypothetical protein